MSSHQMNFDSFSALRRRVQSAKDSVSEENDADITSSSIAPDGITNPSGLTFAEYKKSMALKKSFLLVLFIQLFCVLFELVYFSYGVAYEKALLTSDDPNMKRIVVPVLQTSRLLIWWVYIFLVGLSWVDIFYFFSKLRNIKSVTWIQIVDTIALCFQVIYLIRRFPAPYQLFILFRVVKVYDVIAMCEQELYFRSERLDKLFLVEKSRSEMLAAEVAQITNKLYKETEALERTESALKESQLSNLELQEALLVAAADFANANIEMGGNEGSNATGNGTNSGERVLLTTSDYKDVFNPPVKNKRIVIQSNGTVESK